MCCEGRQELYFCENQFVDTAKILGLVAGFLTTVAFVPQVIKTWQSRSARDLSLVMFLLFCTGVFLWMIYGFMINELPVILWNIITLALALIILFFKLRFKN
ncbi:MAG: SemiSWEET family sugar transporter [Cyclobacteriaceae bacterium]|nr:SemiSWEET family sugar transporter [Cytophagales bacterium]MBX2901293.1 SemiSWEET family sugar transporter [Cyclobacteriaceae bacterium]